jgi:hypothetical protein
MPRGAAPVILAALVATTTAVATSTASAAAPDAVSWSPPLTGEAVGVVTTGGTAQLGPDRLHPDVQADGHGDAGAPGLLTLPAHRLDAPVDRVDAELSLAAGGPDAPVAVDVRGVSTAAGGPSGRPPSRRPRARHPPSRPPPRRPPGR